VAPRFSREWYISPTGSDASAGSRQAPFRTIMRAVSEAGPGEVVRVQSGTYAERLLLDGKQGREGAPITLLGEGKPRIVPSGRGFGMVHFRRPYWVVDGFDIDAQGKLEHGVVFSGDVRGSVLARSEVHHGTSGAGINVYGGAHGATILDSHIHHFSRGSEDAHGVVVQTTTRNTVVRGNNIHDNSGDGVQCLGPEGFNSNAPADGLLIEGNRLHRNQENGVDIKTCHNVVVRGNTMHSFRRPSTSQGSLGDAVVVHLSARNVRIEDNDIFDCGRGVSVGGNRVGALPTGILIQGNRFSDLLKDGGMEGSGVRVETSEGTRIENNTFVRLQGPAVVAGFGSDSGARNLQVRNNRIGAQVGAQVGRYAPGLRFESNLYTPGVRFFTSAWGELSFSGWQARGMDGGARLGEVSLPASQATAEASPR
jgi:nitrous oxidase accessory protein NosD